MVIVNANTFTNYTSLHIRSLKPSMEGFTQPDMEGGAQLGEPPQTNSVNKVDAGIQGYLAEKK